MRGKNVVITGATGGLGQATAFAFARAGAHVILLSRSQQKLDALARRIRDEVKDAAVDVDVVDLADLASVKQCVSRLSQRLDAIDVLVNNAAIYKRTRSVKGELEEMFATNHLGPFTLTILLEPLLKVRGARVLNVTAPSSSELKFDDLAAAQDFSAVNRFGASKTANLLFTFELARRWKGTGVTVDAMHPGLVKSDLMDEMPALLTWVMKLVSSPADKPAHALVTLARKPGVDGEGRFFRLTEPIRPASYALDTSVATRLWDVSMQLAGVGL